MARRTADRRIRTSRAIRAYRENKRRARRPIDQYLSLDAAQPAAMTRDIDVPGGVFAELRKYFSERQTVELTLLISAYNMLTRFLKALKVDPQP